jgi:hypothetical protein
MRGAMPLIRELHRPSLRKMVAVKEDSKEEAAPE